jgi:hypothetical protein
VQEVIEVDPWQQPHYLLTRLLKKRHLKLTTGLFYYLVAGYMIYELACRTPWQTLLAYSAASVKVHVHLPLLCDCFALLFH